MCSRFENKQALEDLHRRLAKINIKYYLDIKDELKQENIAPTNRIAVLRKTGDEYSLSDMGWGIRFENKIKKGPLIFNSRIETIKEKKYWTNLFYNNRCLVPATGFIEWIKDGDKKIPHVVTLKNFEYFFIPAIYLKLKDDLFASLITTNPNKFMTNIHHRMPVILTPGEAINYLNGEPLECLDFCNPLKDMIEMKCDEIKKAE
jgi:putative SOS response-associated peptidase YedK